MKYRVVGWYSKDGADPNVAPFARVVEVEAESEEEAYSKGDRELDKLQGQTEESEDFLNWYVTKL